MTEPSFTLYHYPFCPFCRIIRLVLTMYGVESQRIEIQFWEEHAEFATLSPARELPVLVQKISPSSSLVLPGFSVIMEYLEESKTGLAKNRLLPENLSARVEVRRLTNWFNHKFYAEVSHPLLQEKIYRRFMPQKLGGGSPNGAAVRCGIANTRPHLEYIGHLIRRRKWLAGDELSYADLAAASHLSCVDYLGHIPWEADEDAKIWYARLKSRPAFRPLLADRILGMPPSKTYDNLDF